MKTKLTQLFLHCFLLIIYNALIPVYSTPLNELQETTTQYHLTIQKSSFIDLESLLNQNIPFKVTMNPSPSCILQNASLSIPDPLIFQGSFLNGEKAFQFGGYYYVIQVNPQNQQIHLIPFVTASKDTLERSYIPNEPHIYLKGGKIHPHINDMEFFENIAIFSTESDLLILNFADPLKPKFIGIFPIYKTPIKCFKVLEESTLYVGAEDAILAYDIFDIEGKNIRTLATFTKYILPDKKVQKIEKVQAISICEDVAYFAEGKQIFAIKETLELFATDTLNVEKVFNFKANVLQMIKVGRSLVVVTTEELIEYIFVNDCLDLVENFRVTLRQLGFSWLVSTSEFSSHIELKGSDKGKYFGIINRLENKFYIFETGVLLEVQNSFFYSYEGGDETIDSIDIFDYMAFGIKGIKILLKYNKQQFKVLNYMRNPIGLTCSKWIPGNESLSITTESRFCHNTVYNYTAFVEENLKEQEKKVYNDKFYFDPKKNCQRNLEIHLAYEWSDTLVITIVFLVIGIIMAYILITKLIGKRGKYKDHVRLHNEKKLGDLERSKNILELGSSSLPSIKEQKGNEEDNLNQHVSDEITSNQLKLD